MWGEMDKYYEVIGFDNNNILNVGYMTPRQAMDKGIRDAVTFGPILIVNGEPCEIKGTGGDTTPELQSDKGRMELFCFCGGWKAG